jgi:hypothetical protein
MNPTLLLALANLVKGFFTTPEQKAEAQQKVLEMAQAGQLAELNAAVQIILADASGNWLQRSWRPLLFLTFGVLIVCRWFGLSAPNLEPAEYSHLWDIVELALGGGVIGRSVEKTAGNVISAIANSKGGGNG